MKPVVLTNGEIITCRLIGNMRTASSRSFNVNDVQMGDQKFWDTDEWGVVGEYAFCKARNIFFDPSLSPRSGGHDCILNGYHLDIKTTLYKDGKLVARAKRHEEVDVFVLAVVTGNVVSFPGYCLARELYDESNLTDFGNGRTQGYALPQSKLRKWKDGEWS